jgi:hypothetical protein
MASTSASWIVLLGGVVLIVGIVALILFWRSD